MFRIRWIRLWKATLFVLCDCREQYIYPSPLCKNQILLYFARKNFVIENTSLCFQIQTCSTYRCCFLSLEPSNELNPSSVSFPLTPVLYPFRSSFVRHEMPTTAMNSSSSPGYCNPGRWLFGWWGTLGCLSRRFQIYIVERSDEGRGGNKRDGSLV